MEERSYLWTICLLGMFLCFNKATPVSGSMNAMLAPKQNSTVNSTNAVLTQAGANSTLSSQGIYNLDVKIVNNYGKTVKIITTHPNATYQRFIIPVNGSYRIKSTFFKRQMLIITANDVATNFPITKDGKNLIIIEYASCKPVSHVYYIPAGSRAFSTLAYTVDSTIVSSSQARINTPSLQDAPLSTSTTTHATESIPALTDSADSTQAPTTTIVSKQALSTTAAVSEQTGTDAHVSTQAFKSTQAPTDATALSTGAVSTNTSFDAAILTESLTDTAASTKSPDLVLTTDADFKNACKYEKVYVICIIALGILLAIVLLIVACLVCRTLKTERKTKTSRIEKHELLTDSMANEDEDKSGKEDDPENNVTIQVSEVGSTFATVPPESQTDAATTESTTDATGSAQKPTDTVVSIEVPTDAAVPETQGPFDAAGSSQGTNNAAESDVLAPLSAAVSTMCPTDTAVSPQAPTDAAESTPSPTDLLSEVLTNVDVPNQSPADSAMSSPALVNAAVSSQVSTDAQDPTNVASEEMPNNDVKKSTNQEEGIVETAI